MSGENNAVDTKMGIIRFVAARPWKVAASVLAVLLIIALLAWSTGLVQITGMIGEMGKGTNAGGMAVSSNVIPVSVNLPIVWGSLGKMMLAEGVIDENKLIDLYESRGGMSETMRGMLYEDNIENIVVNEENAQDMLNLFWAFGLANTNAILSDGPMMDKEFGGDPSQFASTGGWTLRTGAIQDHYNMHPFVSLTTEQQALVERVSKNIYRPCCNNSTYFPDCNHGMAMLGLLELLAANNVSEEDMYDVALGMNTYWFPGTYETIAASAAQDGITYADISAKELLGKDLSSVSGFQAVKASLTAPATVQKGGGECSV